MEIITTLQNGQAQTAYVTEQEFQTLTFKNSKVPTLGKFGEIEKVKVWFNGKGEVCAHKEFFVVKGDGRFFKREAVKKNGQLKASTIEALKTLG